MALHYSRLGLEQNGFREVAAYECFAKGRRKLNVQCWTDGRIFLVRDFFSKGKAWDMVYDNKNDANERVMYLWSKYSFHKKVR